MSHDRKLGPSDRNDENDELDLIEEIHSRDELAVARDSQLYKSIASQVQEICDAIQPEFEEELPAPSFVDDAAPRIPETLDATGLTLHQLADLILKVIYLNGTLSGYDVGKQLKLSFGVVEEGLEFLKQQRLVEVSSGELMGPISYRFVLSESGIKRARDAFEECRYVGPAPVSLEEYQAQCRKQSTRMIQFTLTQFHQALAHLVIDKTLLDQLGPAILSGQCIYLYGPPGNGKSVIGKAVAQLMNRCGGAIYVPYAVAVDQHIVTVFDPSMHHTVETSNKMVDLSESAILDGGLDYSDPRWRLVKRPVVIAGGELTLDMLDLRYNSTSGFYSAPMHMKANGGIFMIDDFGRQQVPAAALLNRWILPLEERIDALTLATGKKFHIPFEQLTIISTNLTPQDLGDPAFLRRIRHKIQVPSPSREQFRAIFRRMCDQRRIQYDDWIVSQMLESRYNQDNPPKSSDPRDLLEVIHSICRFRGEAFHLSEELLAEAWHNCLSNDSLAELGETR